jgi:signal transduction histidine kinase
LDKENSRQRNLVYYFALVCITGVIIGIIPDIYFGLWSSALPAFITIIIFILIIRINQFHTDLAANLFIINMIVMIFYYTYALGKESNMQLMLLLIIIGNSFIIDHKKKSLIYFHFIHPPLFYAFFELTNYKIWFIKPYSDISPQQIQIFGTVNLMILFILIPLISLVILRTHLQSEAEIKKANEKLKDQNNELKEKNDVLDQFAYRVSHDLRAPIASSKGLLEIMETEEDLATIKNYHQLMKKSLHRLEDFIREILDQSQNNRTELNLEVFDLPKIIEEVYQQLAFANPEKELKIKIDINQIAPIFVSDANRLKVIFHNLISNAIRYQNPQNLFTEITIIGRVEVEKAFIEIKDNGLGIAKEHLPRVFDMFYRASTHTSGSGLGLFIVKQCIDKLGGKIEVSSIINQGTAFMLELPNYPSISEK